MLCTVDSVNDRCYHQAMNHIFQIHSDLINGTPVRESEPEMFRRLAADRARELRAERRRRVVRTLTGRRPDSRRAA